MQSVSIGTDLWSTSILSSVYLTAWRKRLFLNNISSFIFWKITAKKLVFLIDIIFFYSSILLIHSSTAGSTKLVCLLQAVNLIMFLLHSTTQPHSKVLVFSDILLLLPLCRQLSKGYNFILAQDDILRLRLQNWLIQSSLIL